MISPSVAVDAADHGVRAAMLLDLLPYGPNPIVFGTAADSPRLSHARFLPPLILQQQNARGLCRSTLPHQTILPVVCTRLAAVQLLAKCADMFPLVVDSPHVCFLLDLLQLMLMPLLLSRSTHGHAVRLKKSPFRYARRGCPRLYSHRGAPAAVLPSFRRDTTLPACSYAFTIGEFRRW